jgi:hypothetical protein
MTEIPSPADAHPDPTGQIRPIRDEIGRRVRDLPDQLTSDGSTGQ